MLDQSTIFFPPVIDTYGLNLNQVDKDHLAELHALRQIDPCGFVYQPALVDNGHKDFSYTYNAAQQIEPGSRAPIAPLSDDGCTVAFPSTPIGLSVKGLAGEPKWNDAEFSHDPLHPGLAKQASPTCTYRATLPLTELTGAPTSMHDPVVEVTPMDIAANRISTDDTSLCGVAEMLADDISADVREKGIPVYSDRSSGAGKFLTSDPCAAALELRAGGIIWKTPNPNAQAPTTWRHPDVCNLSLGDANGGPATPTAVVKYGLATWSEHVLDVPWGENPAHSDRDGVALFDFSTYLAPGCLVVAKTDTSIEVINVGAGAPNLAPSTAVVTVQLTAPDGGNCADVAGYTAVAATKRAT